jgi:rare lipoprotein A
MKETAKKWDTLLLGVITAFLLTGCASTSRQRATPSSPVPPSNEGGIIGEASYYAHKYHGRKTASGEIYDMNKLTAAHRTLPFGVTVRVTELSSNRSVIVRINDRGPFARGRIIDVSLAAAKRLGIVQSGHGKVRIEVLRNMTAAAAELPDYDSSSN